MLYRPELARFRLRRYRLRRLHRKLVAIDGRIAFVGGINIVDDDNAPPELRPRFDFAVRIEGPLLRPIHATMVRMWEIVAWVNLKRRFRARKTARPTPRPEGEQLAAFLVRDNIRHRDDIADAYVEAIDAARDDILIANAYFLPGFRFRRALRAASRRGVAVTVLLQGRSDHMFVQYATQALYSAMLDDGIRVFEYRRSFLHAKVAVIDNTWATVGSSNIDPFSLLLAKEANVMVRDRAFAGELKGSLRQAIENGAVELRREDLARLSWHSRLRRWVCYGLVRLLIGLAGYGPRHWHGNEERLGS
jgi:cardiolipin synthase